MVTYLPNVAYLADIVPYFEFAQSVENDRDVCSIAKTYTINFVGNFLILTVALSALVSMAAFIGVAAGITTLSMAVTTLVVPLGAAVPALLISHYTILSALINSLASLRVERNPLVKAAVVNAAFGDINILYLRHDL